MATKKKPVKNPTKPRRPRLPPKEAYERKKDDAIARKAEQSLLRRDIGKIPPVADPERREACRLNFRLYCETYKKRTFCRPWDGVFLPWSDDQITVMDRIQRVVLTGGLFAIGMPRGSAKTSLCEAAAEWAVNYSHHQFVAILGATEPKAKELIASIKTEYEVNDLYLEDFPEICYPIRALQGIGHRVSGQICEGDSTNIDWSELVITLPTVKGSKASGNRLQAAGLSGGGLRGLKFRRRDGYVVRPSLFFPDDPQTDESAKSILQCQTREKLLTGAVGGLAGPGRKISGLMPGTVIYPGDAMDKLLDPDLHPEWQPVRMKTLYAFPTNKALWDKYAQLRKEGMKRGDEGREATEFYRKHRVAMDEGAHVAWAGRFNEDELSAIQSAMNIHIDNPEMFAAEYQNEPLIIGLDSDNQLSAGDITRKTNGTPQRQVPMSATRLTAFVDVQQRALFYCVCAWEDNFSGSVIDYDVYPKQSRDYFQLKDLQKTLQTVAKGAGIEGAIYAGLEKLGETIFAREWIREDGATMRIQRAMVDANWPVSTDVVYRFCRQSDYASILLPSHGVYVGAGGQPMSQYTKKPGERVGLNWRIPNMRNKRAIRHVIYDTNYWKSFVHARLSVHMGDRGCLSLFGKDPNRHILFASHLDAEYKSKTARLDGKAITREVDEWKHRPDRPDNHWLDCLCGAAVAASIEGVSLTETEIKPRIQKKGKVRASDLQRMRRAGR